MFRIMTDMLAKLDDRIADLDCAQSSSLLLLHMTRISGVHLVGVKTLECLPMLWALLSWNSGLTFRASEGADGMGGLLEK